MKTSLKRFWNIPLCNTVGSDSRASVRIIIIKLASNLSNCWLILRRHSLHISIWQRCQEKVAAKIKRVILSFPSHFFVPVVVLKVLTKLFTLLRTGRGANDSDLFFSTQPSFRLHSFLGCFAWRTTLPFFGSVKWWFIFVIYSSPTYSDKLYIT